jgi:hypothetical protein
MHDIFNIGDLVQHTSSRGLPYNPIVGIIIDIYPKHTHRLGVGPDKWLTVYYCGAKGPEKLEDWRHYWKKI